MQSDEHNEGKKTNAALLSEATTKFPGLSKNAFDRAKGAAIAKTGAVSWRKAGAKPKNSPRP